MTKFLAGFLAQQRAKGADLGSALEILEQLAQAEPEPQGTPPAWMVTPEEVEADLLNRLTRPLKTVQELATERLTARAQFESDAPPVVRLVQTGEQAVRTLTACLDDAPCRESARNIFRTLFMLALEGARAGGHSASVTRAVFHLPAELLMAYVGLKKSAFYDNLRYLRSSGLVFCDAHMGDLRGESVATGTLWAISLQPGRVLSGQAAPVRLLADDWSLPWRDLNADVKAGRTVYNVLHPKTKGQPESQEIPKVEISSETLKNWAIHPVSLEKSDTLTVRPAPAAAQNVVWALGDASQVRRHERAAIVDRQARTLASAFGDGEGALGFWRKLIWNITRGIDAGVNFADDVGAVLARVLGDVQHDLSAGGTPPRKPAAVVNAALGKAGLLDQLRAWDGLTVGSRPAA